MRTFLDCVPCFVRQALEIARLTNCSEEICHKIVIRTLRLLQEADYNQSPPQMAQKMHRMIKQLSGQSDPYLQLKRQNNQIAVQLLDQMEQKIASADDKLLAAVKLAIAGNIIDLGVKIQIDDAEIAEVVNNCLSVEFDGRAVEEFKNAIAEAEKILYLHDNAGEIVFDRLLIEQLPMEKVISAVRGMPIINDALLEDAEFAGITKLVKVIDNGSDAPGTVLSDCNQSFRDCFDSCDMVIAKGQGNYETLSDVRKNIFFILKVKCPVIAKDLNCEIGAMVLKRSAVNQ